MPFVAASTAMVVAFGHPIMVGASHPCLSRFDAVPEGVAIDPGEVLHGGRIEIDPLDVRLDPLPAVESVAPVDGYMDIGERIP